MNRKLPAAIATAGLSFLLACGGSDTSEGIARTSAALTAPALTPVPFTEASGFTWKGSPAELMFADAFASCSRDRTLAITLGGIDFETDTYLSHIQSKMDTALCRYPDSTAPDGWKDYGPTSAQPEVRWYNLRNDPKCNIDPSTRQNRSAGLQRRENFFTFSVEPPFAGNLAIRTVNATSQAVDTPIQNLCIAQHLRRRSPGATAGEALLLSAADQRQLLALTKERAQMAMLQFALLGRVFATPPLSNPGAVSNVHIGNQGNWSYFIPMLQQWAQGGAATAEVHRRLGEDFATAVQLHVATSTELAQLLNRSGAARMSRGGGALTPAMSGVGISASSLEVWGPGSWKQRALASLYGGDPLVEDAAGNTPWEHFLDSKAPGNVDSDNAQGWPSLGDTPFVSTVIDDPKIMQLLSLAQNADILYLQQNTGWSNLPESTYQCRGVNRPASAERLYRSAEAYVRTKNCIAHAPPTTDCSPWPLSSIPSSDTFSNFELWKTHRITPTHASTLIGLMEELSPRDCRRVVYLPQPVLRYFTNRGALDFSGEVVSVTLSDGLTYYHIKGFDPRPRVLRETVGLYTRYSRFWMPDKIFPEADPSSQGFDVAPKPRRDDWVRAHDEMRIMGAVPALHATRMALLNSTKGLDTIPTPARTRVAEFFLQAPILQSIIDGAAGQYALSFGLAEALSTPREDDHYSTMQYVMGGASEWHVDITAPNEDAFWDPSGAIHRLFAVADDPTAALLATDASTRVFDRSMFDVRAYGQDAECLLTQLDLAATSASSVWRCSHVIIPATDEQWTFIAERQTGVGVATKFEYQPLAAYIGGFDRQQTFNYGYLASGQYLSFNGTLGNFAAQIMSVDLSNPSKPAFDGFGLPNTWLPPTDPALFGGSRGDDAVSSYLQKAKASAQEATAAVKEAFEEMLTTQQDEASLAAAVSKSENVADLERRALCGSSKCNTQLDFVDVSIAHIWNDSPDRWTLHRLDPSVGGGVQKVFAPRPLWNTLPTVCQASAGTTVADRLAHLDPTPRLDCLAATILSTASIRAPVLQPVARQRSAPATPAFHEYAGGALQTVAIEQWTALRSLEDRIRSFIASTDAAIGHVNLLKGELANALGQEAEMKNRCENLEADLVKEICEYEVTGFPWGLFNIGEERVCTKTRRTFSDYTWEDETSSGTSRGDSLGYSAGLSAFGAGVGTNWSTSNGTSASFVSPAAKRRMCEGYRTSVDSSAWRLMEATLQAYANVQARAVEFNDAAGRLQAASAAGLSARHQATLAIARADLEVDLIRSSQRTSFGLYRQIHSYDAWRAKSLLDGARLSAAIARKAIESRYAVNLSDLTAPEPLVVSPSVWADEVYEYDLDMPSAVGLTVGEAVPQGIYLNRVLDYVGNLERFVNGFSISRPTAVVHDDTELISLPGPRGLDPSPVHGSDLPDGRSYAWIYFCPDGGGGAWRPMQPTLMPSEVCGPSPSRPTRASLLFVLDPWGRLHGDIADEPFDKRHNARWGALAVNLVGTGVLDCSKAVDSGACYTQPFMRYRLSHGGAPWISNAEHRWMILPVPTGRVEAAKALAAEQWLDPVVNSWSKPYVSSVARGEFSSRPFGGAYELEFDLGPEVVLDRIERVQVLAGATYWVRQQ